MALSITLTAQAVSATDSTAYTFSSQSLGAVNPTRQIVVAVAAHKVGTLASVPTVSVAGEAAPLVVNQVGNPGGNESLSALYIADVPTGTTGDVIVTFTDTQLRCGIAVFRIVGLAAPLLVDTDGDLAGSLSVNTIEGGVTAAITYDNNSNTWTWSGLTEAVDATVEGVGTYTAARAANATTSTPLNITVTPSGSFGSGITSVAASWRDGRISAVGSAAGTSTVTATAVALSFAVGAASGAATVSGDGAALTPAVASASGTATVSGVGFGGLRPAAGSAAGQAVVTGIASLLHITNTVGIQKPVDYALAWRRDESNAATLGNKNDMSKALLKSIFRE